MNVTTGGGGPRSANPPPPGLIEPEAGIKKGHVSSLASLFKQREASTEELKKVPVTVRRVPSGRQQPKPQISAGQQPPPPQPPPPPPPPQQPKSSGPAPQQSAPQNRSAASSAAKSQSKDPHTSASNLGYTPVGKPARIRIFQMVDGDPSDDEGEEKRARSGAHWDLPDASPNQSHASQAEPRGEQYSSTRDLRQPRYVTKKTRYTSRTILEADSAPGPMGGFSELHPQQIEEWTVYETLPVSDTSGRRRQSENPQRKPSRRDAEEQEKRLREAAIQQRLRDEDDRWRRAEELEKQQRREQQLHREESERRRRELSEQQRREDEERRRERQERERQERERQELERQERERQERERQERERQERERLERERLQELERKDRNRQEREQQQRERQEREQQLRERQEREQQQRERQEREQQQRERQERERQERERQERERGRQERERQERERQERERRRQERERQEREDELAREQLQRRQEFESRKAAEEARRREAANKTPEIYRHEEWTVYEELPTAPVVTQVAAQVRSLDEEAKQYLSSDSVIGYRRYLDDASMKRSSANERGAGNDERKRAETERQRHREDEEKRQLREEEERLRLREEEYRRRMKEEEVRRGRLAREEEQRRQQLLAEQRHRQLLVEEERRRQQKQQQLQAEQRRRQAGAAAAPRFGDKRGLTKTPEIFSKEEWTVYEKIPTYEKSAVFETTGRQPASFSGDSQDSIDGYRRFFDDAGGGPTARRARSFERPSPSTLATGGRGGERRRSLGPENLNIEEWTVYHSVPKQLVQDAAVRADRYDHLREFQERKLDEGVETRMSTPFRVEEWTVTQQIPLEDANYLEAEGRMRPEPELGYKSYTQSVGQQGWNMGEYSAPPGSGWSPGTPPLSSRSQWGAAFPLSGAAGHRNSAGPQNGNVFHDSFSVRRDNPVFRAA